jgi:OFA family oxalate/formate antiporter-like MFS transporter
MFGRQFATTNYSLLFTAKGAASLLVALCDLLHTQTKGWTSVFSVMIAADGIAALLALLVLRPLRARLAQREEEKRKAESNRVGDPGPEWN